MERADLNLRAENLYALKLAGLSETQDELLTLSEMAEFKPFPSHKFALVDHNRLGSSYTVGNANAEVVAVLDHHEDEGLYTSANPRIIGLCGSCTSHVATLLPQEPPAQLATLLLTGILIDTDGLKPGGKATDRDRESALLVAPKSTIANTIPPLSALSPIDHPNPNALYDAQAVKDMTAALSDKKSDVSHLSGFDLLRRDYKEYTHPLSWAAGSPSIKVGLSTVPSQLKAWGTDGKLEKDAVAWMKKRNITILGVLTSFRDSKGKVGKKVSGSKGKHKREQAWIILDEPELSTLSNEGLTTGVLAKRLFSGLEAASELELKKHKKFSEVEKGGNLPPKSKAKVYKQGDARATRKITAPLVKNILESASTTAKDGKKSTETPRN